MLQRLKRFKEKHPFTSLMLVAILVRIIAVIFVPGFGSRGELQHPTLFIAFLEKVKALLGIGDSQGMMFISRSLYAVVSLFTVSMIYRICDLTSNKQNAWLLALIPAFCCIMPSFGIIENASAFLGLPLMLYGANVVLRQEVLRQNNLSENVHRTSFLIAGLMLGLGICVWYESAFIVFSILLILCIRRNLKGALMTFMGVLTSVVALGLLLWALGVNPLKYIVL
ncbi:MAG: hypothetical protein IJK78_11995 [Bacteroidales bacterium]|jgi:hypothetical protein|nr:hypothetical protein [Bacteroidales bacterium]